MMLCEHVELILKQGYDDVELYARLCALLALWNLGWTEETICPK